MVSDPDDKKLDKETESPKFLEKEIMSVLNKENDWGKYKTEKLDAGGHDSLKKFKSEFLKEDSKTIDINQLKLDINFEQHLVKSKNNTNPTHSLNNTKDNKEMHSIKSSSHHSNHESSPKNV